MTVALNETAPKADRADADQPEAALEASTKAAPGASAALSSEAVADPAGGDAPSQSGAGSNPTGFDAELPNAFVDAPAEKFPEALRLYHPLAKTVDSVTRDLGGFRAAGNLPIAVSIVIPVKDEADNVGPLSAEILAAVDRPGVMPPGTTFEVLFVDDCSVDGTQARLKAIRQEHGEVRGLYHDKNCGQSSAIRTGVLMARGPVIVTLDGDGQNDPADIPALLARLFEGRATSLAMVGGERQGRKDSQVKRMASQAANKIRTSLLRDRAVDSGCGLKAFYREAYLRLPYFDHMHRFMSALMLREGFDVAFVPVSHRPRRHGKSKYGVLDRLWVSISDLVGVMWLARRCRLPAEINEVDPDTKGADR